MRQAACACATGPACSVASADCTSLNSLTRRLCCSDDDSIRVYNTEEGRPLEGASGALRMPAFFAAFTSCMPAGAWLLPSSSMLLSPGLLLSKKYGVSNVCFTHDPHSVIYSSNKACPGQLKQHVGGFCLKLGQQAVGSARCRCHPNPNLLPAAASL